MANNSIGPDRAPAGLSARIQAARARLDDTIIGQVLERLIEVDARTRAVGLAGQAFIGFVPLAMFLAPWSLGTNEPSFSARVIGYLDLTGSAAEAIDIVFGTEPTLGGISLAGVVVIVLALGALAKTYQRVWESAWRFPPEARGGRPLAIAATLLMLIVLVVVGALGEALGLVGLLAQIPIALTGWWAVGYLALRRRIVPRRLLPGAAALTGAHLGLTWWSQLYVPRLLANQVARYGVAGVTFGVVSWLLVTAYVLVLGAVVGAVIDDARPAAVE